MQHLEILLKYLDATLATYKKRNETLEICIGNTCKNT
jgi:hypothetical protein